MGEEANRSEPRKHLRIHLTEDSVAAEVRLDSLYAIRTSLSGVERGFRTTKNHPRIRPIHAYCENHVRGHVFLYMLACCLEWHMRRRLVPCCSRTTSRPRREPSVTRRSKRRDLRPRQAQGRHQDPSGRLSRARRPEPAGGLSNIALSQVVLPARHQTAIAVVPSSSARPSTCLESILIRLFP